MKKNTLFYGCILAVIILSVFPCSVLHADILPKKKLINILNQIFADQAVATPEEMEDIPIEVSTKSTLFYSKHDLLEDIDESSIDDMDLRRHPNWKKTFEVRSLFDVDSPTIRRLTRMLQGPFSASVVTTLMNYHEPFKQYDVHYLGHDLKIYEGKYDVFVYGQFLKDNGEVELKEWIYAKEPNSIFGSEYNWEYRSSEIKRFVYLKEDDTGALGLYRYMTMSGVGGGDDYSHRLHIIDVIETVMPSTVHVDGDNQLARILPVSYQKADGTFAEGSYRAQGRKLFVTVNESKNAYPLIVDPGMVFLKFR